jgi:hypothetical protein
MTWTEIGWVMIGLSAAFLIGFRLLFKGRREYRVRMRPAVSSFLERRVASIERGESRQLLLGDRFWSRAYPGLELHALAGLSGLVDAEALSDDGQMVSTGSGELLLFAQQIVAGRYQDGFSGGLHKAWLAVSLPGPTPLSFLAGVLAEMGMDPPGALGLLGHYGSTAPLITEGAFMRGGHVFSAAGSITAQAALFLNVHDLLVGEEMFLLPGLREATPEHQAGWVTEDILRAGLILLMIAAAFLKMAGVL